MDEVKHTSMLLTEKLSVLLLTFVTAQDELHTPKCRKQDINR